MLRMLRMTNYYNAFPKQTAGNKIIVGGNCDDLKLIYNIKGISFKLALK